MAVKSSGQLAMTEIVAEFGGDAPHAMSEYYGGGDKVPAGANPNVATSGMTKFGDFYDAVAATVLTISSNTSNYNIKTAAVAAGGDQNTPVILTINNGVTVSSSSNSTPAMKTDTGWGSGVTINITNNGSIVGANGSAGSNGSASSGNPSSGGGAGGHGTEPFSNTLNAGSGSAGAAGSGSAQSGNNGANGSAGGSAFEHSQTGDNNLSVIFDTAGTRTGGSGGAGGSAAAHTTKGNGGGGGGNGFESFNWTHKGGGGVTRGGGGGGGANGGAGGARAEYDGANYGGEAGATGGATTGGLGGRSSRQVTGCSYCSYVGQRAGSGGNLQQAGSSGHGSAQGTSAGSGGSAGADGTANGSAGSTGASGSALAGNTGQIS